LDGRTTIITGAGRGIGREHALYFAAEGARVVVNDFGGTDAGGGIDAACAQQVADEIRARGGVAIANSDNVASWDGAQRLIEQAVEAFGDLHVLVNNAGILRDRMLVNMSESEWDSVVEVHLKGHFAPTRFAAAYWRSQQRADRIAPRNVVNTTSTSGLFANPGQANYGAAKSGIATFSQIIAKELERYGVRSNTIAPLARTRLTLGTPGMENRMTVTAGFDNWDPGNISPVVAYLSTAECPFSGETFIVQGGSVTRAAGWARAESIQRDARWTAAELAEMMPTLVTSG
jgi:NAD(P)-dependent dehydrogenase (short-subunit alcohol dehydrogenase family)